MNRVAKESREIHCTTETSGPARREMVAVPELGSASRCTPYVVTDLKNIPQVPFPAYSIQHTNTARTGSKDARQYGCP